MVGGHRGVNENGARHGTHRHAHRDGRYHVGEVTSHMPTPTVLDAEVAKVAARICEVAKLTARSTVHEETTDCPDPQGGNGWCDTTVTKCRSRTQYVQHAPPCPPEMPTHEASRNHI